MRLKRKKERNAATWHASVGGVLQRIGKESKDLLIRREYDPAAELGVSPSASQRLTIKRPSLGVVPFQKLKMLSSLRIRLIQ